MGRRKGGGGGAGGKKGKGSGQRGKPAIGLEDEDMYDEVDQFHKKKDEDFIGLNGGDDDEEEESDDGEEGVFDLDVGGESSEEEDEEDDDEEDDDEDEDDDDDSASVQNGHMAKGHRVEQAGLLSDEDDDDDDEKDAKRAVRQWGTSKQQYYNADATDLEIGQDFADAEEEEEAAREVEQARYDDMDEEDYGLNDDDEEEEDEAAETMGAILKGKGKGKGKKGTSSSSSLIIQQNGGGMEETKISRNLSKLSRSGKLQVLMTDSPELLTLLEEFKEKLGELKERVEPLLPLARQGGARITEEGVAYLEVKQQLLLSYCINLTYYMLLKAEGKSVKDHPVINQLLELRAALEKMRPLDAKLKYHIDRLLKVAEDGAAMDTKDPLSFRPNPDALIGKGRTGADDEEEDEEEQEESGKKGGVYKPPRLAAVPYEQDLSKKGKEEAKARKNLEKLRRNEILQTLTEQFSDKPELVAERGMTERERKQMDDEEERRRFEEERFIRLVTTKKDKKARRAAEQQATRLETIADIGDFQEFEQSLSALGNTGSVAAALGADEKKTKPKAETASALQRAVNSLAQRERTKKRRREADVGDADVPYRNPDEIRVRRPVPDESMNGDEDDGGQLNKRDKRKNRRTDDDDEDEYDGAFGTGMHEDIEEDPIYEAIANKKAEKKAAKEALYAVEPNYGGMEEELMDDTEKRGINYQILKNRGLTPYKNKLNRNPRVKKREAYRKAVIRRKGQVRNVGASEAANYGGEATGINARVVRTHKKKR